MFFILSKVLGFFASPSNLLICMGLIGLCLSWTRWRRAGMRLMATAALLLFGFGVWPLSNLVLLPLRARRDHRAGRRDQSGRVRGARRDRTGFVR